MLLSSSQARFRRGHAYCLMKVWAPRGPDRWPAEPPNGPTRILQLTRCLDTANGRVELQKTSDRRKTGACPGVSILAGRRAVVPGDSARATEDLTSCWTTWNLRTGGYARRDVPQGIDTPCRDRLIRTVGHDALVAGQQPERHIGGAAVVIAGHRKGIRASFASLLVDGSNTGRTCVQGFAAIRGACKSVTRGNGDLRVQEHHSAAERGPNGGV